MPSWPSVPFALAPLLSEQALVQGQEGWVTVPLPLLVCALQRELTMCCSAASPRGACKPELCQMLTRHPQVSFTFY